MDASMSRQRSRRRVMAAIAGAALATGMPLARAQDK
jgi:hypothetical protein